jgi:CheY-like chemotaxis protein
MTDAHILVVDDSAEVAFILGHISRRAGWEIIAERDAEKARTCLRQQRPTLVLLDVNLPGASGYDFCHWLRGEPTVRELPVAMFSQWHRPEDMVRPLQAGADFVISKDLLARPNECRQRLGDILAWTASRSLPIPLRWADAPRDAQPLVDRFNRAVRESIAPRLGGELLRVLLAQGMDRVRPGGLRLAPGGVEIALERGESEAVRAFIAAFADQVWRVLETGPSVPLWRALGAEVPSTAECPLS